MSPLFVILLAAVLLFRVSHSRPTGAPESACDDMTPRHGDNKPQSLLSSPYTLTANPTTQPGAYQVGVVSPHGLPFMGLFLQARLGDGASSSDLVGSFSFDPQVLRPVACSKDAPDAAITHVNSSAKNSVVVTWTPPSAAAADGAASFAGNVTFNLTVVQQFHMFWTNLSVLVQAGAPPPSSGAAAAAADTTTTTTPATTTSTETPTTEAPTTTTPATTTTTTETTTSSAASTSSPPTSTTTAAPATTATTAGGGAQSGGGTSPPPTTTTGTTTTAPSAVLPPPPAGGGVQTPPMPGPSSSAPPVSSAGSGQAPSTTSAQSIQHLEQDISSFESFVQGIKDLFHFQ